MNKEFYNKLHMSNRLYLATKSESAMVKHIIHHVFTII